MATTRFVLSVDFEQDTNSEKFVQVYEAPDRSSVPENVYHGREIRFECPELRDGGEALIEAVRKDCEALAALVSIERQGSNYVGVASDEEAFEALVDSINQTIDSFDNEEYVVQRWSAPDWFAGIGSRARQAETLGITAAMSDEELSATARAEVERAEENDAALYENEVERHFAQLREDLREVAVREFDAASLGIAAAATNPSQAFGVAAEAAIPEWITGSEREALVSEFVEAALEALEEQRAMNPNAFRV